MLDPRPHVTAPARMVEHVELSFGSLPRGVTGQILRGAVNAQLEPHSRGGLHVDWHQHGVTGTRQRAPRIMYRVRGSTGHLWMWGERSREHAALAMRHLLALRLPRQGVIQVPEVRVDAMQSTMVGVGLDMLRYEIVTPIKPASPSQKRWRRDMRGPEWLAWAAQGVTSSVRHLLSEMGHAGDLADVCCTLIGARQVGTRYKGRWQPGVTGTLWTNAVLPDGAGVGQHRSIGMGEVRRG